MNEIICINSKHREILKKYIRFLKRRVYVITEEDKTPNKFGQFNDIIEHIVSYSNDFKINNVEDNLDEWVFIIPNLSLYACMGFIVGLRNKEIDKKVDFELEMRRLFDKTLDTVGDLSDMLSDHNTGEKIEKELCNVAD